MKIKAVGPNQTVATFGNGIELFYSYSTPVAAFIPGEGYVKTDTSYSKTKSRHINAYAGKTATVKPQSFFDNLA